MSQSFCLDCLCRGAGGSQCPRRSSCSLTSKAQTLLICASCGAGDHGGRVKQQLHCQTIDEQNALHLHAADAADHGGRVAHEAAGCRVRRQEGAADRVTGLRIKGAGSRSPPGQPRTLCSTVACCQGGAAWRRRTIRRCSSSDRRSLLPADRWQRAAASQQRPASRFRRPLGDAAGMPKDCLRGSADRVATAALERRCVTVRSAAQTELARGLCHRT